MFMRLSQPAWGMTPKSGVEHAFRLLLQRLQHVDDDEDHQWVEEARTPEEGKQLEREKPGNYLGTKNVIRAN